MKGKQLGILLVAAVVLGALGWYVRRQDAQVSAKSSVGMGQKLLGQFDVNSVGGIRLVSGTNAVNVALSGDKWVVKERGGFAANFSTVADFVRKLSDLKVTKPLNIGSSRLAALDLVPPDKGSSVLVELLGADGKPLKALTLGKKVMREGQDSSPFGGGGGYPVGRYVMVGNDVKSAAVVNDALGGSEANPQDWLLKDFFKVEPPILSVSVQKGEPTNSFSLTRTNEFSAWELVNAKAGEALDATKANPYSSVLSAPSFNDVVAAPDLAALGLDKPTVATVKTTAGFTYEVKLGKEQGSNSDVPVQFSVKGDFAKERTPGKDEKAEDKDKLDKEFKDKLTKLEEKLKTESELAKWTFLVSKWSLDALLKNRSELFADKKAEESSSGAGTPPEPGANILPDLKLDDK